MVNRSIFLRLTIASLVVSLLATAAQAHFLWVDFTIDDQRASDTDRQAAALIYFSETPAPGERHLIGKVAHTRTWTRTIDGQIDDLKLTETAADRPAALAATATTKHVLSVEATCDYGILQRGPVPMLLHYYAKHLASGWPQQVDRAAADRLRLDLSPRLVDGKLELQLRFDGQPDPSRELIVVTPQGEQRTRTDSNGSASFEATPGHWGIRAAHIDTNQGGERDGKSYGQVSHYATLTLTVPSSATTPTASAADVLKRAREARVVWTNFPGFEAQAVFASNDERLTAKIAMDSAGSVTIDAPTSPLRDWAEEQLNSLAQHRMPAGEIGDGNARFADEAKGAKQDEHPLGRRIDLGDATHQSVYRVAGDVITEVNRAMGKTRFTISVLEVTWTPQKKYLPRTFTISFFDAETGALQRTLAYWNDWRRVGDFELPQTILEVSARDGKTTTRRIELSELRLRSAKP